jgi:hypothetical protein
MVIGLFGRQKSGKRELANICEEHGFTILTFASALKELVSKLVGFTVDSSQKTKDAIVNLVLNEDQLKYISDETSISIENVKSVINNKCFYDVREMLQFIGTDVIRRFNPDWHVSKIRSKIKSDKNYVIDDGRFPNERKMIEDLGGDCWFMIRPSLDNISNHESETSLRWQDFDKIIVNNSTLSYLRWNWTQFIEGDYSHSITCREKLLLELRENKKYLDNLSNGNDLCGFFSMTNSLLISIFQLTYESKYETDENIDSITVNNDNTVNVKTKDGKIDVVNNPLVIENLKFYIN